MGGGEKATGCTRLAGRKTIQRLKTTHSADNSPAAAAAHATAGAMDEEVERPPEDESDVGKNSDSRPAAPPAAEARGRGVVARPCPIGTAIG
jgi:hypothetical protein